MLGCSIALVFAVGCLWVGVTGRFFVGYEWEVGLVTEDVGKVSLMLESLTQSGTVYVGKSSEVRGISRG